MVYFLKMFNHKEIIMTERLLGALEQMKEKRFLLNSRIEKKSLVTLKHLIYI